MTQSNPTPEELAEELERAAYEEHRANHISEKECTCEWDDWNCPYWHEDYDFKSGFKRGYKQGSADLEKAQADLREAVEVISLAIKYCEAGCVEGDSGEEGLSTKAHDFLAKLEKEDGKPSK